MKKAAVKQVANKFIRHVVPGVVRPLHVLWNQVIGFFFVVIAGIAIPGAYREVRDPDSHPRLILTIPFILIMGGFGIASFLKARRVSRS